MKLQQYQVAKLVTYEVDVKQFCEGLDKLEFTPDDCLISKMIDLAAEEESITWVVETFNALKEFMILPPQEEN